MLLHHMLRVRSLPAILSLESPTLHPSLIRRRGQIRSLHFRCLVKDGRGTTAGLTTNCVRTGTAPLIPRYAMSRQGRVDLAGGVALPPTQRQVT